MKPDKVKYRRKPTPIRTAIFWISLTSNIFLGVLGYGVYNGKVARTEPTTQSVDFVTAIDTTRR